MKVIFDLDGTLALIDHRRHLVSNGKEEWDEFYKQCVNDLPNKPVIRVLQALQNNGMEVWILSGRSNAVRMETNGWLKDNGITCTKLVMRPAGNKKPDVEIKADMIKVHELTPDNVLCIFEDRNRMVEFWRKEGFTCLQVAEGDF